MFKLQINQIKLLNIPHIWILDPPSDHPKYWEKLIYNLNLRIKILKRVCKFVQVTERFKDEKYGL